MRRETYLRELVGSEAYEIAGHNSIDEDMFDFVDDTQPIKMEVKPWEYRRKAYSPHEVWEHQILPYAHGAFDEISREYHAEFADHAEEIFFGEDPDWQINGFRVLHGAVEISFQKMDGRTSGCLFLTGLFQHVFTFTGPRTRLGFDPTYKVICSGCRDEINTIVIEDMGYMIRKIRFLPRENRDDNQVLEITECASI